MDPTTLKIRIISPRALIFQGEVKSISSENISGKFDILPQHANFITLIEKKPLILIKIDNTKQKFDLSTALIYCSNSVITIYTDLELPNLQKILD